MQLKKLKHPEGQKASKANFEFIRFLTLAVRKVTQLNSGKKTAGVDGVKVLMKNKECG